MSKSRNKVKYPRISHDLRSISIDLLTPPRLNCPYDAVNVRILCTNCSEYFKPAWGEPLPREAVSLEVDNDTLRNVSSVPMRCPRCGFLNRLEFPVANNNGHMHFFGDEASDFILDDRLFFYVYSFISLDFDEEGFFIRKLAEAKAKLRPNVDPKSWHLHIKDIRNQKYRSNLNIELEIDQVNAVITSLIEALSEKEDCRKIFTSVHCVILSPTKTKYKKKDVIDKVRNRALVDSLYTITKGVTKLGFSIDFTLEAQDKVSGNYIDNYVEQIGRSLRRSLPYMYSTNCAYVGLPRTVSKKSGSCPELEYADLVSYYIRRYLLLSSQQKPFIDPSKMGDIIWITRGAEGLTSRNNTGFPWEQLYGRAGSERRFKLLS